MAIEIRTVKVILNEDEIKEAIRNYLTAKGYPDADKGEILITAQVDVDDQIHDFEAIYSITKTE